LLAAEKKERKKKKRRGKKQKEKKEMTSPSTIIQKFVSRPNELGVVTVGFSGGQVGQTLQLTCRLKPDNT
jgi:hypothetical protein